LIANSGIAVNQKYNYSIVQFDNKKFIIATNLIKNIAELCK
jgi:isoleucyl-tRNA synthetase